MPALLPYYAALLAGIVCGIMGQILLKTGAERTAGVAAQFLDPFTILGFATYTIAAIFYIIAIKKIPLSQAFPSVSASYVIVAVLGHLLWGEPLGVPQFAGIALIAGGILLLHQT
ncbi:MAG TPA: EamA family transporter [Stellaceae bacterium]|nr:EamA family transporter [Stellaceae bacterium]